MSDTSFGDGDIAAWGLLSPVDWDPLGYAPEYMPEKPSMSSTQNVGLDGACRDTVLLLSMTFTADIVGRSAGLSWTHSNPMLTSFSIWQIGRASCRERV